MATYSSMLAWRIPMVRGAWQATGHEVAESDTTYQVSTAHVTSQLKTLQDKEKKKKKHPNFMYRCIMIKIRLVNTDCPIVISFP